MFEKRVVRGNTYALMFQKDEPDGSAQKRVFVRRQN